MSNTYSFIVDDDFTLEVLEGDDDSEDCVLVNDQEQPDRTKPNCIKNESKSGSCAPAKSGQSKNWFMQYVVSVPKRNTKNTSNTVKNGALEFKALSILQEYKDMLRDGFFKKPYECPDCPYKTDVRSSIENHVDNHLTHRRPFRCKVCNYAAFSKNNLTVHRTRCDYKFKKCCPHCPYVAIRNKTFRNHLLKHSKFSCVHCKFYTDDDKAIEDHKKICKDWLQPIAKCDVCDYQNSEDNMLKWHMGQHHPEYQLKCDDCNFVTCGKKWLERHRQQKHLKAGLIMLKCDQCKYTTFVKTNLQKHMLKHSKKDIKEAKN